MLSLAACAPQPIVRTKTVYVRVPVLTPLDSRLTSSVIVPALPSHQSNGDLAQYIQKCGPALDEANQKLKAIRDQQPKKP